MTEHITTAAELDALLATVNGCFERHADWVCTHHEDGHHVARGIEGAEHHRWPLDDVVSSSIARMDACERAADMLDRVLAAGAVRGDADLYIEARDVAAEWVSVR